MKGLQCPQCSREFVKRISRRDWFERFLSNLYFYPFRCQMCGHRFRQIQWGIVYRKVDFDRREFERLPVHFPVSISAENGEHCEGVLQNLSMWGCGLTVDVSADKGSILCLELHVPNVTRPIVVQAAAVRSVGPNDLGVEFLKFPEGERARLRMLVRGLLASRSAEAEDQAFGLAWGEQTVSESYGGDRY